MNLNDLRDTIYQDAVEHGLYDEQQYDLNHQFGKAHVWLNLARRIKEEVQELIVTTYYASINSFTEELADIIIICLSVAGHLGIDIDAAVRRKMEINKGRPWKHEKVD